MRTIDSQFNINEISSSTKYDDVKCNIEHDLESAEAVEVRTRMRRRGASILETAAQQSGMDALCVPSAGRVTPNQELKARVGCHQGECCSPPIIGVNLPSPIVHLHLVWCCEVTRAVVNLYSLLTHICIS